MKLPQITGKELLTVWSEGSKLCLEESIFVKLRVMTGGRLSLSQGPGVSQMSPGMRGKINLSLRVLGRGSVGVNSVTIIKINIARGEGKDS